MAYYAYKTVRDLLPEHIIKEMGEDYEGDGNYDGDQWYAAEAYILELIQQRDAAQADSKRLHKCLKDFLPLMDKAFDYEGDVFGKLHNDAVDAIQAAKAALKGDV